MNVEIKSELVQFNKVLGEYMRYNRRIPEEAVLKPGKNFAMALRRRLLSLAPAKGSVRQGRLKAAEEGEGIKVRPSALKFAVQHTMSTASNLKDRRATLFMEKNRKGNLKRNGRSFWQVAIGRELAIRESGRGHLSVSAMMGREIGRLTRDSAFRRINRAREEIGRVGLRVRPDLAALLFEWHHEGIVTAMGKEKAQAAIAASLAEARDDMLKYIRTKAAEAARKTGLA